MERNTPLAGAGRIDQIGCHFACRIAVIERVSTKPSVLKLEGYLDRLPLAGLRQRGFQFARRIAIIDRGPTKPLVFKLDDYLDGPVVADSTYKKLLPDSGQWKFRVW